MAIAADPPGTTGGTLANGLYFLTATNVYTGASSLLSGPTGRTLQDVTEIAGTVVTGVSRTNGGTPEAYAMTVQVNGTGAGSFVLTCGTYPGATNFGYTVNGNTLKIYSPISIFGSAATLEEVLTLHL